MMLSDFYRKDVTVRIGAIIRSIDGKLQSSRVGAACSILTVNEAFDTLGIPAQYSVISIYTDKPEDNERVASSLADIASDLPYMSLENWASDVKSYKIYNMLVAIFAATLIGILIVVTFVVLMGQIYTKTCLSFSTYNLFRINGMNFATLIKSWLSQIFLTYFVGVMLSVPITSILISRSMKMINLSYYLSIYARILITVVVFIVLLISLLPSLVFLYKHKENIGINNS